MRDKFAAMGMVLGAMVWGGAAFADEAVCLSQPLEIGGKTIEGCLSGAEAADLLDQPLTLTDNKDNEGLELTHPTNIRQKKKVRTCRDYQTATGEEWFAMTTYDMTIEGHFQKRCGLLSRMAAAKAASANYLPKGPVTEVDIAAISVSLLALFDPEGTADLAAASGAGKTLKDFEKAGTLEVKTQAADRLDLAYRAFSGTIRELARGDFTGDGVNDALVICGVHAQEGSYRVSDLMVVTKLSADGALEVVASGG